MEFPKPIDNGFTVYSKSGCGYCVRVKTLLKQQDVHFHVIDCDEFLLEDKPGFLQFILLLVGKEYKTFPMVFFNGTFLGGFKETELHFKKIQEKELKFDDTTF